MANGMMEAELAALEEAAAGLGAAAAAGSPPGPAEVAELLARARRAARRAEGAELARAAALAQALAGVALDLARSRGPAYLEPLS